MFPTNYLHLRNELLPLNVLWATCFLSLGKIYLYLIYSSKLLTMRPLSREKHMKWQHYLVSKYSGHIHNTIEACRQCGVQSHELILGNSCQLVRSNRKQKQSNMGTQREKERQIQQALRNVVGSKCLSLLFWPLNKSDPGAFSISGLPSVWHTIVCRELSVFWDQNFHY